MSASPINNQFLIIYQWGGSSTKPKALLVMREKIDEDSVSEDWIEIPMDTQGGVPKEVSSLDEE